jgi:Ca-activated chloride channel homolog
MRGQVKDEAGNPLQSVSVFLHSSRYTYFTRAEGIFGFNTNVRYDSITISREGYNDQKAAIDATQFIELTLKKSPIFKNSRTNKLVSLTQNLKRETQQLWFTGDETYAMLRPIPQPGSL